MLKMAKDSYFTGRGFDGFGRGDNSSTARGSSGMFSGKPSTFMEANQRIEDAVEKRDEAYNDAVTAVAAYAVASNKEGASSIKNITEELGKLLRSFSAEERAMILTKAMASVIINL